MSSKARENIKCSQVQAGKDWQYRIRWRGGPSVPTPDSGQPMQASIGRPRSRQRGIHSVGINNNLPCNGRVQRNGDGLRVMSRERPDARDGSKRVRLKVYRSRECQPVHKVPRVSSKAPKTSMMRGVTTCPRRRAS
eukprot:2789454-Pleurochrysis_carterae.AAC.1